MKDDLAKDSLLSHTGLLFGTGASHFQIHDALPSPIHSFVMWQKYLQSVNPLSKLVHAPTMQLQIINANKDPDAISPPMAALLFAIYAAAIMSMKEAECLSDMGESRRPLWEKFISAAQKAFVAADLMKSRSLTLLQAFAIYLVSSSSPHEQ